MLLSGPARAQPGATPIEVPVALPQLTLGWEAPPGCPDVEALRSRVASYVGEPPAEARLRAFGRVREAGEGYAVELEIDVGDAGAPSVRELAAPDCEQLTAATAVILAVTLAPLSVAERFAEPESAPPEPPPLEPAPAPAPAPEPAPEPEPEPEPEPAPGVSVERAGPRTRASPTTRPRGEHDLRVTGGFGVGLVPSVGVLADLTYAGGTSRWRVELGASYSAPREARYSDVDFGARVQAVSGAARGCVTVWAGSVRFPFCGGAHAGVVLARGLDVENSRLATSPWGAASISTAARWRASRVMAPYLGVEGLLHVSRPAFHVGGRAPVFRSAPVSIRVLVGIELRLR
ncbi:MAG: hypothetical protein KC468_12305 [Myxococcales bacterium]|nr:hypothetical protein [Myxococcales bacterium]